MVPYRKWRPRQRYKFIQELRFYTWGVALLSLFGIWLSSTTAHAQAKDATAFQVQQYRPWMDPYGMLQTSSGETLGQWNYKVGLSFNYSNVPLRILEKKANGETPLAELIGHQLAADIVAGIGFTNWFDLELQIPLTLYQSGSFPVDNIFGDNSGRDLSGFFLGDIKIALKFRFLTEKQHPVGLGLQLWVGLPTAVIGGKKNFNGEEPVSLGGALLFNKTISIFTLAINFGYRYQPRTEFINLVISHELYYSIAASLAIVKRRFDLLFDVTGSVNFTEQVSVRGAPFEFLIAGRIYPLHTQNLAINIGGGFPLTSGYGTPLFRVFAGLVWSPREQDTDGDGLLDFEDKCPKVPGPRENTGCPWPDTDGDGLLDKDDRCPKVPGPKENQGCPWPDTDGDGLTDNIDKCPRKPGPKANQGCPYGDRDGDGLLDNVDKCPDQPGPKENNGCPWPDTDKDGLTDNVDKCPTEPGPKSNNGCPLAIIKANVKRIYILKKVFFDFNKDTIKPVSFPVLDAVANILNRYPKIHLRVDGHTDDVGSRSYNQKLSERRAKAVRRYLVGKGITANRLTHRGNGESQPLVGSRPKFTKEEQAKNRRVEFHIVKQ